MYNAGFSHTEKMAHVGRHHSIIHINNSTPCENITLLYIHYQLRLIHVHLCIIHYALQHCDSDHIQ